MDVDRLTLEPLLYRKWNENRKPVLRTIPLAGIGDGDFAGFIGGGSRD